MLPRSQDALTLLPGQFVAEMNFVIIACMFFPFLSLLFVVFTAPGSTTIRGNLYQVALRATVRSRAGRMLPALERRQF